MRSSGIRHVYVLVTVVVFAQFCVLSSGILHPMDFLALQSIRKSLDDFQGSTFFSTWDFTSDPCSNFTGVFCESDRIVSLNLGDPRAGSPGLTGRLDPSIGKLSALAEFTLVPGRVVGAIPSSISQCTNLRFLAVSRNFLSGEIPASLGTLRSLQTLDLSFNQLTGSIPYSIGTLPGLRNVILCHNKLSGSIPLFTSPSLTKFDLKHNDLSGSVSSSSLPSSVQYLALSSNRLAGPIHTLLEQLTQLNYLDLSMNNFNGRIPPKLFTFPLTYLQLQRNSFSGRVLPGSQVTIQTVDLSFNRLYGEVSPLFSTVENLYLNNNRFTGVVPVNVVDRLLDASVKVLYLQHNFLTGIEISPAAEIPVSSSLCLQYNCMVPPVQTLCPLWSGKQITRPATQCGYWKKLSSMFGTAAQDQDTDDHTDP